MKQTREERLQAAKLRVGTKHQRKLRRYSDSFNEMFHFFFMIHRTGIITFCGSKIDIRHNRKAPPAKECFRMHEDGHYSKKDFIETSQPNVLRAALIGKKGWGLWTDQWSDGIAERSFSKDEILNEFVERGINVPVSMMKEFDDRIDKKRRDLAVKYYEELFGSLK